MLPCFCVRHLLRLGWQLELRKGLDYGAHVLGMPGRAVLAFVTSLSVALTAAAQSGAVSPEAYTAAVDEYRNGRRLAEAVVPLQEWTRKDFDAAVDRLLAARNVAQLEASAVFELEIGLGVMSVSPQGAEIHFELGEKMLRSLAPTAAELRVNPARAQEVHELWSTWFGVAGSGYLWITDAKRARPWINKALQFAPHASALKVIKGAAHEIDAAGFDPDQALTLMLKTRVAAERSRHLTLAEDAFRDAVTDDPSNAMAHIRLGRVLFRFDKLAQARESIERGRDLARKPADRYLALLFLGAVRERLKDMTGAREAYTLATAIAPRAQTATVALAHLDLITGRPDRAQALARAFAAAPRDDQPWWEYKNGGLDHDGLASLRERIRR